MNEPSDALVLFGITGDLAYEKIIPALQAMIQRKSLSVPVVGVASSGWSRDKLLKRMHASLKAHDAFDASAFEKLSSLFEYVDGDYTDPATFGRLRDVLGGAERRCTTWRSLRRCSSGWSSIWRVPAAPITPGS